MLSGIRVLIVEDEALVAATLSDAVENAGGEIVGVAHTVSEARELIRRLTFDAAVLDLHLPDGDVTPVLEALHARHTPTVVYSGGELPEKVRARPRTGGAPEAGPPGKDCGRDPPGAGNGTVVPHGTMTDAYEPPVLNVCWARVSVTTTLARSQFAQQSRCTPVLNGGRWDWFGSVLVPTPVRCDFIGNRW
jgi:CheY-like chemotaxis protein